jgi:RNA polymerase sigma factor (TIGR02999 family)
MSFTSLNPEAPSFMSSHPIPEEVTRFLSDSDYWNAAEIEQLAPLVYEELHRLAHSQMNRERPDHTLQTTALVNEAYLRLADQTRPHWRDRGHFFAGAAQIMRHVLINYARNRQRAKRGGGAEKVNLDQAAFVSSDRIDEFIAIHDALEELAKLDQRKAQTVELTYFGGLSYVEVAEVLDVSPVTVKRDLQFARAWLHKELAA